MGLVFQRSLSRKRTPIANVFLGNRGNMLTPYTGNLTVQSMNAPQITVKSNWRESQNINALIVLLYLNAVPSPTMPVER